MQSELKIFQTYADGDTPAGRGSLTITQSSEVTPPFGRHTVFSAKATGQSF